MMTQLRSLIAVNRQIGKDTKHYAVYCLTDLQVLNSVLIRDNISLQKKMQAIHYTRLLFVPTTESELMTFIKFNDAQKWPVATLSVADLGRGQTTPPPPP
jgi:hypothetical protein